MKNHLREVVGICGLFCETCPVYADGSCKGCLSDCVADACVVCRHGFRDCAKKHHITWCSECADFPCERLVIFKDAHYENGISHHEHIMEYVSRQREIGPEKWAAEQEALNACSDCGTILVWCEEKCRGCGKVVER